MAVKVKMILPYFLPYDRDQYVYSGMHEGIISAQKFEAAQTLLDNMKHGMNSLSTLHVIEKGIFMGFVPVNHKR